MFDRTPIPAAGSTAAERKTHFDTTQRSGICFNGRSPRTPTTYEDIRANRIEARSQIATRETVFLHPGTSGSLALIDPHGELWMPSSICYARELRVVVRRTVNLALGWGK
jgi:hypothetical protein